MGKVERELLEVLDSALGGLFKPDNRDLIREARELHDKHRVEDTKFKEQIENLEQSKWKYPFIDLGKEFKEKGDLENAAKYFMKADSPMCAAVMFKDAAKKAEENKDVKLAIKYYQKAMNYFEEDRAFINAYDVARKIRNSEKAAIFSKLSGIDLDKEIKRYTLMDRLVDTPQLTSKKVSI